MDDGLVEGEAVRAVGVVKEDAVGEVDPGGVGRNRSESELGRVVVDVVIDLGGGEGQLRASVVGAAGIGPVL